jgi:hypothetical protein
MSVEDEEPRENILSLEEKKRLEKKLAWMQELKDKFYDTDGLTWDQIIDQKNYKQWAAYPPGCNDVPIMKARTRLSCPVYAALDNALVWDIRGKWDLAIKQRIDFEISEDYSYMRFYQCYKAPVVSDRDMYLEQFAVKDFPRPGDISLVSKSIVDLDECPEVKGKVRATLSEQFQIMTPVIDEKSG